MAKGESPTHIQTPHTLLVVDDERSLRFTIGEWARDLGFAPLEAANGSEALERVREQAVDVVLLDLRLTNEDGMEVLKRLRDEDPSLPVIMLTGHGTVEHAVQATKIAAYDFVTKPPALDKLGVTVARAIEHARLQREVQHLGGGMLLLDEIGEMAYGLQAKLRRVLETLTFRRVGGSVDITVDVRVVAATPRDVRRAVADGRFREDLSHRLNVVPIELPPLRSRPEDITLLAEHFIARFCRELGRPLARLDARALVSMRGAQCCINVRELRTVID